MLLDNKGALINNEHAYIFPKQGITYGVIMLKKRMLLWIALDIRLICDIFRSCLVT